MKKLLLLTLPLIAVTAIGAVVTATWTNPTQNTDGSAIPATGPGSIASSRVEWGTCIGGAIGTKLGEKVTAGSATTAQTPDLAPGTYCATVKVTNTYGAESAASAVAQKVVAAPTPNAPTGFSFN